jgi:hypothetical protein
MDAAWERHGMCELTFQLLGYEFEQRIKAL